MATIRLTVDVEPSDLAADLLQAGGFDIMEFILSLDEEIGDEDFTLALIQKLTESLSKESGDHTTWLAERALEQNFGENNITVESAKHPIYMRNYAKEWEEESDKRNKLLEVEKLLSSLVK